MIDFNEGSVETQPLQNSRNMFDMI